MDNNNWIYEKISEASQAAQKAYIIYLSCITYSALTIATISDLQIITNDKVMLPILGIQLPIDGFFLITPIILLIFYIYFQIYQSHLIKLLNKLTELNLTDFKLKYYPWILNILIFNPQGFSGFLHRIIYKSTVWWSLPLCLFFFPLAYIKKHDIFVASLLGLFPAFGTSIVLYFWISQEKILNKNKPKQAAIFKDFEINTKLLFIFREYGKILLALFIIAFTAIFYTEALQAIKEKRPGYALINKFIFAKLENIILGDNNIRYNLDHIDLYGATLNYVSLKNANIRDASFNYAKISNCNFDGTDFSGTNFNNAFLNENTFKKAKFNGASLDSTHSALFIDRGDSTTYYQRMKYEKHSNDFSEAEFRNSSIKNAFFSGANFSECNFNGVDIDNTTFENSNFNKSFFTDHIGLPNNKLLSITNSTFRRNNMDSLVFNSWRGAFQKNTLIHNKIRNSIFNMVDMTSTIFLGNILSGTDFNTSNLSGVRFWDEKHPNYEYNIIESTNHIMYSTFFLSKNPIKNNLKQVADVKRFISCKMDSTLLNALNTHYPSLIKSQTPLNFKPETIWEH